MSEGDLRLMRNTGQYYNHLTKSPRSTMGRTLFVTKLLLNMTTQRNVS
jgi:hypothetical protein